MVANLVFALGFIGFAAIPVRLYFKLYNPFTALVLQFRAGPGDIVSRFLCNLMAGYAQRRHFGLFDIQ